MGRINIKRQTFQSFTVALRRPAPLALWVPARYISHAFPDTPRSLVNFTKGVIWAGISGVFRQ